ncbi:MAG: hypothetical protein ACWA6U_12675 [Breznakibacter sp.]
MMLYRIFSKNNFFAFALLPILLVGLRARLLFHHQIPLLENVQTPLWELFYNTLKANPSYLHGAAIILTLISALAVNRLTNHYNFTQRQTNLAGFFYIVFCSGFIMVQELQPILIFVPFFIIAMERLFQGVIHPNPMRHCFEATLWVSTASLFYGKGIWFFPLLFLAMAMMRIFNLKSFIAASIGLILPYLFATTYYLLINQLQHYADTTLETMLTPIAFFNHTVISQIYLAVTTFFVLISLLSAIRRLTMVKIITRKYYRLIIWTVFFPSALVFTPYFSFDVLPVIAIGASVAAATMMHNWQKNSFKEAIILILISITVLTQWLVG